MVSSFFFFLTDWPTRIHHRLFQSTHKCDRTWNIKELTYLNRAVVHDNRMACELKLLYFDEIVSQSLECRSTPKVSSLIFFCWLWLCWPENHCSDFLYRFYRYTLMLTALILCCLCSCVQWVRIGSPHQFCLPSCCTAVFYQSSTAHHGESRVMNH